VPPAVIVNNSNHATSNNNKKLESDPTRQESTQEHTAAGLSLLVVVEEYLLNSFNKLADQLNTGVLLISTTQFDISVLVGAVCNKKHHRHRLQRKHNIVSIESSTSDIWIEGLGRKQLIP
jgi:hypothetical protein